MKRTATEGRGSGNALPPRGPEKVKVTSRANSPSLMLSDRLKGSGKTKIVEIVWDDAVSVGGLDWEDEHSVDINAAPSVSLGYLVAQTKEAVTVVSLINESHYAHGITIPMGMVVEIRELG